MPALTAITEPRMPTTAELVANPARYDRVMPVNSRWRDGWLTNMTSSDGFCMVRYPGEPPFVISSDEWQTLSDCNPWGWSDDELGVDKTMLLSTPTEPKAPDDVMAYVLTYLRDSRGDSITREEAGKIADSWVKEGSRMPCSLPADWIEGWVAACESIAMALRIEGFPGKGPKPAEPKTLA